MEFYQNRKKHFILAGLVMVVIATTLTLALLLSNQENPITQEEVDVIPEANFDPSTEANIINSELLFEYIKSADAIAAFSRDLHTFGRAAYDPYKKNHSKPVGFEITSDISKRAGLLTFEGRFGSSQNKIVVRVEMLKNDRFKVSVTDTVTKFAIDEDLPSNSKINQFLGSLPVHGEGYNVTYVSDNTVNIGLYFRDPNLRDRARQAVVDMLGEEDLMKLNITETFPSVSSDL